MIMMFESMQEISDRLPAKSTPSPESLLVGDRPVADPQVAELISKISKLEESILKIERMGRSQIDMDRLSLFPNAKLPEKFKGMDFAKFDGTTDLKAHLLGYVGSLSMPGVEKYAMAQLFHESLTGPALQWFLSLAPSKKKTWEDIGMAFVSQYDFNVELKMTTRELENSKIGENESFADYVKRRRAKVAQMLNKPDLKEQIQALRDGTLEKKEPALKGKGLHPGDGKVLFGNNNTSHVENSSNAKPLEINQIADKPTRTFTQFSTPLSTLYEQLFKAGLIKPLLLAPIPQKLPTYHDPNAFCAFHQMPDHVTDKCHRLRHKIQDLIDSETILPPPKESSTLSNHHINYINTSSTIFDSTHYIIPAYLPKPIVPIPDESNISVLEFEPTIEQRELKELRNAVEEMGQKMDTQMIQIGALTQKMDSLLAFIVSDPK
ncbi:uncharacterized protein LOC131329758 [Rhododendron vialii]|uniref:uncharacterized protein LOC131329758 n=1 Tax=Rhododendron vialii TaxID=182163 RepID=UPI00265DEA67|nr:uncharacterized protein LOC131329758 [Rhododendron vialii]